MRVQCPPDDRDADATDDSSHSTGPARKCRTLSADRGWGGVGDDAPPRPDYGLNSAFFRRAWTLLRIMFPHPGSFSVFQMVMLLVFCGAEQYVVYWVGIIPSRYYQVLGDKNLDAFGVLTAECLGLVLVISFVKGSRIYISTVLYVTWRELMDRALHRRYFTGINYYLLNVLDTRIDNPDQRITQDVDKLCKTLSNMLSALVVAPAIIGYYTYSVYINTGYIGVLSIYCFFIVATAVNKGLMAPIVAYVVKQEEREGTFRFKHMQIRVHAEALAFHGCGGVEEHRCNRRLAALISTQLALQNRRFLLTVCINTVDYLGGILNYLVISIPIFAGLYDDRTPQELSALISRNSFVCMYLIYNFTQLVDLTSSTVDLVGVTHRISELIERLDVLQRRHDSSPPSTAGVTRPADGDVTRPAGGDVTRPPDGDVTRPAGGDVTREDGADVTREDGGTTSPPDDNTCGEPPDVDVDVDVDVPYTLRAVTVTPPGRRRPLVRALSLSVRRRRSVLVAGVSSCGKTSLLRVLRGLWPAAAGSVHNAVRPGSGHVLFMPQRPFFTDGSLRQQIVYPERLEEGGYTVSETEQMLHNLQLCQLSDLAEHCGGLDADVTKSWYDVLSPGEMQRLCFVRIFHHRPVFVFLDEATSAVSPDTEEILYRECLRLKMTLFSVGHRESLTAYHDWKLRLSGHGDWQFEPIPHASGDTSRG